MSFLKFEAETEKIIAAVYEVSNELGAGFLESVYEKALLISLRERGLTAHEQCPLTVTFHDEEVGAFFADIVVENKILLELKAVNALQSVHTAQILNYLKATKMPVGLLINFGTPKVELRRYTFDNE